MRREYQCCNNKSLSTKSLYEKCNFIGNHCLLYQLLFTIRGIFYCMCLSVRYSWISYSISYSLYQPFLLSSQSLLLSYSQLYQIFPNASLSFSCSYSSYQSVTSICYSFLLYSPIRISYQFQSFLSLYELYQLLH